MSEKIGVSLYRASGISGRTDPPVVTIVILDTVPESTDLERSRRMYEAQAKELVDALIVSLPGGTMDAMLRDLLGRKASLLRVTTL